MHPMRAACSPKPHPPPYMPNSSKASKIDHLRIEHRLSTSNDNADTLDNSRDKLRLDICRLCLEGKVLKGVNLLFSFVHLHVSSPLFLFYSQNIENIETPENATKTRLRRSTKKESIKDRHSLYVPPHSRDSSFRVSKV